MWDTEGQDDERKMQACCQFLEIIKQSVYFVSLTIFSKYFPVAHPLHNKSIIPASQNTFILEIWI